MHVSAEFIAQLGGGVLKIFWQIKPILPFDDTTLTGPCAVLDAKSEFVQLDNDDSLVKSLGHTHFSPVGLDGSEEQVCISLYVLYKEK
jgi:hypothetical protein